MSNDGDQPLIAFSWPGFVPDAILCMPRLVTIFQTKLKRQPMNGGAARKDAFCITWRMIVAANKWDQWNQTSVSC